MTKTPKARKTTTKSNPEGQAVLPETEQFTSPELDENCLRIAKARRSMNRQKKIEQEEIAAAMGTMKELKRRAFTAHGVELAYVAGVDKLRVRLVESSGSDDGE